jgi:hypothetical protein
VDFDLKGRGDLPIVRKTPTFAWLTTMAFAFSIEVIAEPMEPMGSAVSMLASS